VDGGVDGEVELHVPLEIVDNWAAAADPLFIRHAVGGVVGDYVPVAGRCFGIGSVGPELRDHTPEVAARDDLRRVRLTGRRVFRIAAAVVGSQRVVAERRRRDVHRHAVVRCQIARGADHLDRRLLERRIGGDVVQSRRRRRQQGIQIRGERPDVAPLRRHIDLDRVRDRNAVLGDLMRQRERLPLVRIIHRRTGQGDDERRIHRSVAGIGIVRGFIRAVAEAVADHRRADTVADRRRRVAGRFGDACIETEGSHARVKRRQRRRRVRRDLVALRQDSVGGIADGLRAVGVGVRRRMLLGRQVTAGGWVVSRPRVPHRDREVKEIAGMNRRARQIDADGGERFLIPLASDRLGARCAGCRRCGRRRSGRTRTRCRCRRLRRSRGGNAGRRRSMRAVTAIGTARSERQQGQRREAQCLRADPAWRYRCRTGSENGFSSTRPRSLPVVISCENVAKRHTR